MTGEDLATVVFGTSDDLPYPIASTNDGPVRTWCQRIPITSLSTNSYVSPPAGITITAIGSWYTDAACI